MWQENDTKQFVVTAEFVAQSLDQMRQLQPLTLSAPPERRPVLVPGCGDTPVAGCSWTTFQRIVQDAIDPQFTTVKMQPLP